MAVATRHLWAGLCVTGNDIKTPRQTRSQSTCCATAPCLAFSSALPASTSDLRASWETLSKGRIKPAAAARNRDSGSAIAEVMRQTVDNQV